MKKKILIVDDDKYFRILFGEYLNNAYDVYFAESGAKAIQKTNKEKYDLILMDINMPELNGYQTSNYINSKNEIPILGISSEFKNNVAGNIFGIKKMLSKHISQGDLIKEIRNLTSESLVF